MATSAHTVPSGVRMATVDGAGRTTPSGSTPADRAKPTVLSWGTTNVTPSGIAVHIESGLAALVDSTGTIATDAAIVAPDRHDDNSFHAQ